MWAAIDVAGNTQTFVRKAVPGCIDPTYCEVNPPVPTVNNAQYRKPVRGSLRYDDGEVVTYTCEEESKYWAEQNWPCLRKYIYNQHSQSYLCNIHVCSIQVSPTP